MTPAENLASVAATGAASSEESAPEAGPFVINLCSSSTPMALPRADLPELQRFNFFVSRRFEEGRERFRLHMGFFDTLTEAEGWLGLVREIYPGAWAGEAPGKKLRARAAAAAAAQAAHATGPHSPAPVQVQPAEPADVPEDVAARVPTLHPPQDGRDAASEASGRKGGALESAQTSLSRQIEPEVVAPPVSRPPAASPEASQPERPQPQVARVLQLTPPDASPRRGPAADHGRRATQSATRATPLENSNIKEVLAALDEPGAGKQSPADEDTRIMAAPGRSIAAAALSDSQALQVLEGRAQEGARPAAFAVQLQWSVQPIVLDKVPPLAIFSAYTLYCIEGSREGRKWYGLRLGFFNDPISAKQVAGYVRSEFASVAVVPVSADERKRVSGDKANIPMRPLPRTGASRSALDSGEFKLFDSDHPAAGGAGSGAAPSPGAEVRQLHPKPAARADRNGKINALERRTPQTLEETLEILGANELTIDDGKRSRAGGGSSRKMEKSAPFTRLLERLGERVRKS